MNYCRKFLVVILAAGMLVSAYPASAAMPQSADSSAFLAQVASVLDTIQKTLRALAAAIQNIADEDTSGDAAATPLPASSPIPSPTPYSKPSAPAVLVPPEPTPPPAPQTISPSLSPQPIVTPPSSLSPSAFTTPGETVGKSISVKLRTKGDQGPDIEELQQRLNRLGFRVAEYGPGSSGQETNYFGDGTTKALSEFQKAYAAPAIAAGTVELGVLDRATKEILDLVAKDERTLEIEQLTLRFLNTYREYQREPQITKQAKLATLLDIARQRAGLLAQLAKEKPRAFLTVVLPASIRADLPREVAPLVERDVTIEGEFIAGHEDDFEKKVSREFYYLKTPTTLLSLTTPESFPLNIFDGVLPPRVQVSGIQLNDITVIPSVETGFRILPPEPQSRSWNIFIVSTAYASSHHIGNQRAAVLLVHFDDRARPITRQQTQALMRETDNFFRENSYNRMALQSDVFGWFALNGHPRSVTFSDIQSIITKADPLIDFRQYSRLVVIYSYIHAGGGGWGTLGPATFTTNEGTISIRVAVVGIHSNYPYPKYTYPVFGLSHELAHNLGFMHANSRRCFSQGNPVINGPAEACTIREYGDQFEVLGNGLMHMSAPHKKWWFTPTEFQEITPPGGRYTLSPYELAESPIKAYWIRSQYYRFLPLYFEFRQPIGFDARQLPFPSPRINIFRGLLPHLGDHLGEGSGTQLLDATPETQGESPYFGFDDAAIEAGRPFFDPISGTNVNVVSVSSTSITFDVSFTPVLSCIREIPIVRIEPNTQWGYPGAALSYTVTISNFDSSPCGPSTFSIAGRPPFPAGWTGEAIPPSITIEPNLSASVVFQVASPLSVPNGFYPLFVQVGSPAHPYQNSRPFTYVVSDSPY